MSKEETVTEYTFDQLIDIKQVCQLLESHNGFSGMAYALYDAEENRLTAIGWQDICVRFHRQNSLSSQRCSESDDFLKPQSPGIREYRCKNGMIDVAMPIIINGKHLATFFVGQFFYDDDQPDREYFRGQGIELGFDLDDYLEALDNVPVFSRDHVHGNMRFLHNLLEVLAKIGLSNLKLECEVDMRKRAEHLLSVSKQEFRALVENASDLIFRYDRDCRRTNVNPAVERLFGIPADTLLGKTPDESMLIGPAANAIQMQCIGEVLAKGQAMESEMTFVAPDGRVLHFLNSYIPEWSQDGDVTSVLSIFRDITGRKKTETLLYLREQEFRTLAENSPDCIVRYDKDCRRMYVNPAFEKLTGKPAALLLGTTPSEMPVNNARIGALTQKAIELVLAEGIPTELELTWEESGRGICCYLVRMVPEFDHVGALVSVMSNARDISEIRSYQQQLHDLAFFDSLTGLFNRAMFNERLLQSLAESTRREQCMGLMFLDLDNFKIVNDIFGHTVGDRLLRESGARIRNTVRDYDTVARLVGDEFAVILPEIRRAEHLGTVARKILNAFAEPFLVDGEEHFITISIGITFLPMDGIELFELVQHANVAMHHAKTLGGNSFQFYSATLTAQVTERQALESGLRKALSRNELELFYQPKVALSTGALVGAEALLRWNHPVRGLVLPETFIGIAEDSGRIVEIGEWVLRNACLTVSEWNREAVTPLKIAVNMSSRQFAANNIVGTVSSILEETGCRAEWLEIEITESLLLDDSDVIHRILDSLHDMGITLAIDDFGTGYSALSYLTRFPIDILKIDRSFIRDITSNPASAELVSVIISLAGSLNMGVVAEGIESPAHVAYLTACGCDHAQGYLFGKPMTREQFEVWMLEGAASKASSHNLSHTNSSIGLAEQRTSPGISVYD